MMCRWRTRGVAVVVALSLAGCSYSSPYVGRGPHPQITRGRPNLLIDTVGNFFALPAKLLLLNPWVDIHTISNENEAHLIQYIDSPLTTTDGTHFSLNEYAPGRSLKRLVKNKKIAWPYRLVIGLPITLLTDVLLPGRLFGGFIGGDSYNPYTDTVSIYSNHSAIALHEAGHADDINDRRFKGTYALLRLVPFVDLYQESEATDEALRHFIETGKRDEELAAYKILYPAFGTYAGGYLLIFGGSLIGAVVGHIWGRAKARSRVKYYNELDASRNAP